MNDLQLANTLYAYAQRFGGCTIDCSDYSTPTKGFVVGYKTIYKYASKGFNEHTLAGILKKIEYKDKLYIGSWKNKDGIIYINLCNIFKDYDTAIKAAKKTNEYSIYNLTNKEEIKL